jgi:hypothetical protein
MGVIENMSIEELKAALAAEQAENAKLKAKTVKGLSLRVSLKGGVSVYGLGRFPVTLYKEQWEKLLGMAPEIADFIEENKAALKTKAERKAEVGEDVAA